MGNGSRFVGAGVPLFPFTINFAAQFFIIQSELFDGQREGPTIELQSKGIQIQIHDLKTMKH